MYYVHAQCPRGVQFSGQHVPCKSWGLGCVAAVRMGNSANRGGVVWPSHSQLMTTVNGRCHCERYALMKHVSHVGSPASYPIATVKLSM